MLKLRRFLADYKKEVVIGPICKLFEAILELLVPLVMADIIDVGINTLHDSGYVLGRGALMVLLAAMGLTSALFCQYFASKASQGAGTKIRRALLKHINSLSYAELDRLGTPSLITRMTSDVNQVQQSIAMSIRLLTRAPFIIVGSLVMAMTINLQLSLIFFAASVLIALTLYVITRKSVPLFSSAQKKLDKIGLITRENLSGSRVIRAFSKQEIENRRVDAATDDLARTSVRVSKLSALLSPVTYAVTDAAIIAIVWFGAVKVNAGDMQTGDIVALVSYMTQILLAMVVVANLVILMTKASACAERINEVFETKPSVKENAIQNISVNEKCEDKLRFENVSFHYNDGKDVLTDISFAVPRGATLGIIGGTGCGKSSLIRLIPRFYDVNGGSVLIDGADVRDYPFAQLRRKMGIVPQNSVLFAGTIRDNMKWRAPDATDEQIIAALKTAQAYEFVSRLSDGLNSHVEQGGRNFSGGQRQRLCIARALIGSPELLILDDSFSALDMATDSALRRALKQCAADMTMIIVTQRCASVREADIIICMDDGRIAGCGTHEALMRDCGVYRAICLSQQSAEVSA